MRGGLPVAPLGEVGAQKTPSGCAALSDKRVPFTHLSVGSPEAVGQGREPFHS